MLRLSACLITLNEERNLPRALASLEGVADEILVVDSGSTDRTREVAGWHGARVIREVWRGYPEQRNFAAAQASYDWILGLDADEELSCALRESLLAWKESRPSHRVYEFARKTWYLGAWIKHSGWYPDHLKRLYHRDHARFAGRVHESLQYARPVGRLPGEIFHYTVRSFDEHAANVEKYTTLAAEQMLAAGRRHWRAGSWLAPGWSWFQTFVLQRGFLDGYRGWLIASMAARSVHLKYKKLGILLSGGALEKPRGDARA